MFEADLQAIVRNSALTSAAWYERQQLWRFLCAAAETDLLQYPLEVFHTSDSRPDFLLKSGAHRIGIEASRLTTEAYERLERLRAKRQTGPVITISAALVTTAHLRNDELIGMSLPGVQGWGRAVDAEDSYIQRALQVIGRKTKIRREAAYQDYGQNWLLLWDKLSISDRDFLNRPRLLQSWLKSYWNEKNRFDMMIIESEEFSRFAILTPGELRWLPIEAGG